MKMALVGFFIWFTCYREESCLSEKAVLFENEKLFQVINPNLTEQLSDQWFGLEWMISFPFMVYQN